MVGMRPMCLTHNQAQSTPYSAMSATSPIHVSGHEVQLVVHDLLVIVELDALDARANLLVHAVVNEDHRPGRDRGSQQHSKVIGDSLKRMVPIDQSEVDKASSGIEFI